MLTLPRLSAAIAACCFLLPASASAATSVAPPTSFRPFAPDSIWNTQLRDDAAVDVDSSKYVGDFLKTEMATGRQWISSASCGTPIYWAPAGAPRVKVTQDPKWYQDANLRKAWASVPMPDDAAPANCLDKNLVVLQRQDDGTVTEWEFWKASKDSDGNWMARWGGVTTNTQADSGIASVRSWRDPNGTGTSKPFWNVTASSISSLAGLVTFDELNAGRIDHALSMVIGAPAKGKFRWPAQRTDGSSTRPYALPEGSHLRIDPSVDLSQYAMTPAVRMMAEAAQQYGIVVRDQTGSDDAFLVEQPRPGRVSPLQRLLNNKAPDVALKAFPWAKLQLLAAPTCTSSSPCTATPTASLAVNGPTAAGSSFVVDTRNSKLNAPRTQVSWDLDGDGTYETAGGREMTRQVTLDTPGPATVGVQIQAADGTTVTARRQLQVGPSTSAPTTTPPAAAPTASPQPSPTPAAQATPTATPAPVATPAASAKPTGSAKPAPAAKSAPAATPAATPIAQSVPGTAAATAPTGISLKLASPTRRVRAGARTTMKARLAGGGAPTGRIAAYVKRKGAWKPFGTYRARGRHRVRWTVAVPKHSTGRLVLSFVMVDGASAPRSAPATAVFHVRRQ